MVAPSLNQGTKFFPDPTTATVSDVRSTYNIDSVSTFSVNINGTSENRLRIFGDVVSGSAFLEIDLPQTVDLQDKYIYIVLKFDIRCVPVKFGLVSTSGTRMFTETFGRDFYTFEANFDTAKIGDLQNPFNINQVTALRWELECNQTLSNRQFFLLNDAYFYNPATGVVIEGGEVGNLATINVAGGIGGVFTTGSREAIHAKVADTLRVGRTLTLNSDTSNYTGSKIVFAKTPFEGTASNIAHNLDSISFNQSSDDDITNLSISTEDIDWDYTDDSVNHPKINAFLTDSQTVDLGTADYSGVITGATEPTTGGRNVSVEWRNCTSAITYELTGVTNLSGATFNSPAAEHYINIANTVSDGAVLDVSDVTFSVLPTINIFRCDIGAAKTLNLIVPAGSGYSTNNVTVVSGSVNVSEPPTTFTASNLTTATFNNVRCRLSLVPGSPATINDDGTIASGGINFATSDVNTASNTIALTGIAGKLNSNSVIRFYGSDLPEPIDSRAVYYPSTDYDDSNNLSISSAPGGSTISLTDVGSGSDMYGSGWTELDISLVTSGSYAVDITASASTAGVTVANNDILVLQAIHHDPAGTGGAANISNYLEESFLFSGANITSLSSLSLASLPMSLLAELGQDGSQVTGYSVDAGTPSKVQIDVSKTAIDTKELLAFYYYTQWTESGMRFARGNAIVENLNSIALRGELTFDAASRSVMSGPFTYRLDGGNIVAPESQQISFNWENTRAAIVETEVAVDLPSEVLQAIHSILYLTSQIPNISSGSGGDATAANQTSIINTLASIQGPGFIEATDSLEAIRDRGDTNWITATGFSSHNAADVRAEIDANSTQLAAILANTGTDIPVSISALNNLSQADIRTAVGLSSANLDAQLGDIPTVSEFNARTLASADYFDPGTDTVANVTTTGAVSGNVGGVVGVTFPSSFNNLSSADVQTAATASLNAYNPPTRAELTTDINSILTQGNSAWATADVSGLSTFNAASDQVIVATNNDKTGYSLTQAFPSNFSSLAIDGSGQVTAGNMRGTDGALTSFSGLPNVTVGGYAAGQAPNDLIDISTIQSNVGLILGHTRPMAKQLGLVSGVTATHTPTAITVSDGDGSTTITDNGSDSYTVQGA